MTTYHESQKMRQPLFVAVIAGLALLGWAMFVQQIVRGKPFGSDPAPDWAVILLTGLLGIALPAAFFWFRMETEVYPDRVEIRQSPLSNRTIPASQIGEVTVRVYRPLREFGGWGIRGWGSNRAYNMSGDRGVQLVLKNGDRLLIGSQRAEELGLAIEAIIKTPRS